MKQRLLCVLYTNAKTCWKLFAGAAYVSFQWNSSSKRVNSLKYLEFIIIKT